MKLIPNAKHAWKFMSMQLAGLAAASLVMWQTLPADALAAVPEEWRGRISLGLIIAAMIGRMIDQGSAKKE